MKYKFCAFDFDQTLANTPEAPPKSLYSKIGWDGKDWWGSPQSLDGDIDFNPEVLAAFKAAKADPDTHVIMLTGRRDVISGGVRKILQQNELFGRRMIPESNKKPAGKHIPHEREAHADAHEEYYSGDWRSEPDYPTFGKKNKPASDTLSHKIYILKRLAPAYRIIDMWEDRSDYIPHFLELGLWLQKNYDHIEAVTVHRVFPHEGGYVIHIPVIPGKTTY